MEDHPRGEASDQRSRRHGREPVVGSTGRQHRGLPSLYTADEVRAWRVHRRLQVKEMALLLGWPESTLSKKLGRAPGADP
jgi:hypothetical protein